MSENVTHIVWGAVAAIAIMMVFGTIQNVSKSNLEFDRVCIEHGKSVQWNTKQGSDSAMKECK